jgi:VTC domain
MHTASTQVAGTASPVRGVGSSTLAQLLCRMAPTTLPRLDAVALLNRSDTKFLLTQPQLISILPGLAPEYRVLEIEGRRLHHYRTLYFDTPDFDLYRHHHAGRAVRHKVRSRLYVDSGLSFFEIKSKQDEHRTVKQRLATPAFLTHLTPDTRAFVASYLSLEAQSLQPTLRNDFLRVTLVAKCYAERLTLDLNVQFDCEGRAAILPGIVIAELKQGAPDQNSPFLHSMRQAHVDATSISKYCVGVGLLVDTVEHEAFDEKLNELERLMRTQTETQLTAIGDVLASQA